MLVLLSFARSYNGVPLKHKQGGMGKNVTNPGRKKGGGEAPMFVLSFIFVYIGSLVLRKNV